MTSRPPPTFPRARAASSAPPHPAVPVGHANGCSAAPFFALSRRPQTNPPTPCNTQFDHNGNVTAPGPKNFMRPPVYNNYGPPVGFAWQALNKTVVRGGVGLFWDTLSARSQYARNDIEGQRWPWSRGCSVTNPHPNTLPPRQRHPTTSFGHGA